MASSKIGNSIAPWRFLAFGAVLAVGLAVAVPAMGWGRGLMAAFDAATGLFLLLTVPLLRNSDAEGMRRRARDNDANRVLLLALTGVVTTAILVSVALELSASGKPQPPTIALVVVTLAAAWLFSNTIYALHYAHLYYLPGEQGGDSGGLCFPKTPEPEYWDFVYFAFTLGMAFQTSDTEIETQQLRRTVTGHCLAAFVFNLGVVAFTINVLGN